MRIETFRSRDLEKLTTAWNQSLPADPISAARLEARVLLDPNYREDLCLVAWEGERLVGFVLGVCGEGLHFPGERAGSRAWILALAVVPTHVRRGIGSALLEALEQRFLQTGKNDIWMASYPTAYIVPGVDEDAYAAGLAFLQARGYCVAYRALAMDAPLWPFRLPGDISQQEERLTAEGISFRTYSPRWLSAFRQFLRTHLPWDWEWLALTNLARIHQGTFFPRQFQLATCGKEVVGYCQHEGAHFGPIGVAEEFQERGIGTILLARALQSMAREGLHNAWVLWTGDRAARLYGRFGFRESRKFAVLHKTLC